MVLSDRTIREEIAAGRLIIDPFDDALVQPSSVDLRVANEFRVFRNHTQAFIDPAEPEDNLTELVTVTDDQPFVLHPGEFVLGSTLERVGIPGNLVARLEGKSSLGRLGLLIRIRASTRGRPAPPAADRTRTSPASNVGGRCGRCSGDRRRGRRAGPPPAIRAR